MQSARGKGGTAIRIARVFLTLRHARAQQEEHARQMALIEREILGDQQRLIHKLQPGQGRRNAGK